MATSPVKDEPVLRGRPRSPQTHDAILDAARQLLLSDGESRFTIERVAAAAGVSKASIYRRWQTKGALLIELYMAGLDRVIVEKAQSLRVELKRYLRSTVKRLQDPLWRSILRSLAAEGQYDAVTAQLLRDRVVEPRRASGLALLRHAEELGEIPAGLDHETIVDLLFGPVWYRLLFEHAPLDEAFVERLLKQVEKILFPKDAAPRRRR